jgi:hypothetical protein
MNEGCTRLIARYSVWGVTFAKEPPNRSAISGASTSVNGRPRPTMFSHMRLCDSCRPSDSV